MLNICALLQRIPHAKNYSTQFSRVPVFFFSSKYAKVSFSSPPSAFFFLLLLILLLFSSYFATKVPSTRIYIVGSISAALSGLSAGSFPEQRLVIEQTRGYGVRSWAKLILTFHGPANTSSFRKLFFKLLSAILVRVAQVPQSCRVPRSFHRTVFFGAPLAFLRVVKVFFRSNLFLEAS